MKTKSIQDPQPQPPQCFKRPVSLWKYLFFVILTINLIVVGRDVAPRIKLRMSRLQMAENLNNKEFLHRALLRGREELNADRSVPVDDQTRFLILNDIRTLRLNPLSHSWPQAMLARGIVAVEASIPTVNSPNITVLRKYYDDVVSPDGKWLERLDTVDKTMHGPNLLYLFERTKDSRYRKAADQMASYLLNRSAVEGGTISYRIKAIGRIHLVDTLGMICPFLVEYGQRFNKPQAVDVAVRMLEDYVNFGIEPRSGLPFHGYNPDDSNRPTGTVGWGRGTGWYALGLADTLALLDNAHPKRPLLEKALRNLATSLRRYQRHDGGWNALINVGSDYDSSATAMLTYLLQQGVKQGILTSDYSVDIALAMDSLKRHTRADGTVDFAQGNLMSLSNHSTRYSPAPYAQGMVLTVEATQTLMK